MSKLDDILNNEASTLFCMGQDWTKGDGNASKVDGTVDSTKQEIKDLIQEMLEEMFPGDKAAYQFWKKVEQL